MSSRISALTVFELTCFQIHGRARDAFESGTTKSVAFRKEQIAQVGYLLKDNEDRLREALKQDLGRPPLETDLYVRCTPDVSQKDIFSDPADFPPASIDFSPVYMDVAKAYGSLGKWTAPKKAEFDFRFWAMGPKYRHESKGVVLIIAPFNGPVVMTISPLVRAAWRGGDRFLTKTPLPSLDWRDCGRERRGGQAVGADPSNERAVCGALSKVSRSGTVSCCERRRPRDYQGGPERVCSRLRS